MTDSTKAAYHSRLMAFPEWRQDGDNWHLLVGNESAAQLRFDAGNPDRPWLATFGDAGKRHYRIGFAALNEGKAALDMWWYLTQRPSPYAAPDSERYLAECERYRISQNWSDRKWMRSC